MDKSVPLGSALIALAALLTTPVLAQTPPDAGRILQEQAPTVQHRLECLQHLSAQQLVRQ